MDIANTIVVQLAVVSDVMCSGTWKLQRKIVKTVQLHRLVLMALYTLKTRLKLVGCLLLRTVS